MAGDTGKGRRWARVLVDAVLAALFVAVMATALVQKAPHEYLGVALFVAIVAHVVLNRRWVKALFRGRYDAVRMLQLAAGVSPSQAPVETILAVDLYGTAVLLEEVGKVIAPGGAGVTISSQSGKRMPQLTADEDRALATTPPGELLGLPLLAPENIRDTLHAYQLAKRCNEKRVMYEAVRWGERGARINSISPGIIVTPSR